MSTKKSTCCSHCAEYDTAGSRHSKHFFATLETTRFLGSLNTSTQHSDLLDCSYLNLNRFNVIRFRKNQYTIGNVEFIVVERAQRFKFRKDVDRFVSYLWQTTRWSKPRKGCRPWPFSAAPLCTVSLKGSTRITSPWFRDSSLHHNTRGRIKMLKENAIFGTYRVFFGVQPTAIHMVCTE